MRASGLGRATHFDMHNAAERIYLVAEQQIRFVTANAPTSALAGD